MGTPTNPKNLQEFLDKTPQSDITRDLIETIRQRTPSELELLAQNSRPKQTELEGILDSITKVETKKVNLETHGGYCSHNEPLQTITHFQIKTSEDNTLQLEYPGVILPDSIGHKVLVRFRNKEPYEIFDRQLQRGYSIS
jgi:hypothetical protein